MSTPNNENDNFRSQKVALALFINQFMETTVSTVVHTKRFFY